MKTQLSGLKQLYKGELVKIIADKFGTGEINEKMGKNNKNFKWVNIQVASKVFLNSGYTLKMPKLDGLSVVHLRKKLKLSGPIIKESLWSYLKRLPNECSLV